MPVRSQEPLPGLPRGCRVPKLWAALDCFPRPQAGSWMGSGAVGIRTSVLKIGPGAVAQVVKSSPCTPGIPYGRRFYPSIPAAPLPFQLPACGLGKQWRTAQGFGNLRPCGRPGRGSWLRIGIVSVRCAHLGSESSDGRSSSLSLLSVYPPFQ